ncbi:GNAT family N-acetyltransferase [Paenibacillus sp. J5C_2022]|uniref:GNAT family N-acetyltransferase n=1 Tax=Paenibacillus sp. J5C2022 TaxID=2977129 RepID=UPI0021CFDB1F|nr:GNAT family N-acetyltransferase [Paenibacillus sp. J5C2022]MCU6713129.1 GNAT family N-acetyltransferase [Paenibacillus sp. J5C2022]
MSPEQSIQQLQIVEYDPSYAGAIAEMWNESQDSWGGGNHVRTAELVAREIENGDHLHVFLAVIGAKVVGYCSFAYYKHDEGALYVPLLNVSPAYHGHKIGKSLILTVVKKTVEMGWPRLDLFTWAGNTKAVPMYKKCGFFWEKKDDSVHLMNFIPTVLQTEALLPSMEKLDWYADSMRTLDISPDGRKENGFEYYTYNWKNDIAKLRVEFEKTGRGLRLIETDEYIIHTEIEGHDLVFGYSYAVRYVVRNKTGKPLECAVRGVDHKNIRFRLEQSAVVEDTWIVEGQFQLGAVAEEQSDWKTHPAVTAVWTINGREATFRTGIAPKFPAKVELAVAEQEQYADVSSEAFMTFENHYNEAAEFRFALPPADFITFEQPQLSVSIPANGRATVPIRYTLSDYGLYSEDVSITAMPEGRSESTYVCKLHGMFKGNTGRFGGDVVHSWVAVNGSYTLSLNKTSNEMSLSGWGGAAPFTWYAPRIGKPFSSEFVRKRAEQVSVYADGDAMVIEASYPSDDFPGLTVISYGRLRANGLAERWMEVRNDSASDERWPEGLYVNEPFYMDWEKLVLPYDGRYYDLTEPHAADSDDWELERLSENWLFSRSGKETTGFCWHPSAELIPTEWHFGIAYPIGAPAHGDTTYRTPPTVLAVGTYPDWWDFRSLAMKRREAFRPLLSDPCELLPKELNPFTRDAAVLELKQHRNQPLDGIAQLSSSQTRFEPERQTFRQEDERYASSFKVDETDEQADNRHREIETAELTFEAKELTFRRSAAYIPMSDAPITQVIRQGAAGELYNCSNGTMRIEASPAFGAALHSLQYRGEEWLDSSYPEPGPRSWMNPWLGGISASLPGMSPLSLSEETHSAAFASLTDNRGNVWSGIELRTSIRKHEKWRGLELSLYALMLPGSPVLCCVVRLSNRSGLFHTNRPFKLTASLSPGGSLQNGWVEPCEAGAIRYRCGIVGMEIRSEGMLRMSSDDRSALLHAVNRHPGSEGLLYTNNALIEYAVEQRKSIRDGASVWGDPVFFTFGTTPLAYKQLKSLVELQFHQANQ